MVTSEVASDDSGNNTLGDDSGDENSSSIAENPPPWITYLTAISHWLLILNRLFHHLIASTKL